MIKRIASILLALVILAFMALPAAAITGGLEDGNGHPYGALILVPGITYCSGTLIDENVVLTAGHCTNYFTQAGITEMYITFDPYAAVDLDTWQITGGTWYTSTAWVTHPDYVDANWPFTADYGLVFLDDPVAGITPAGLPEPELLDVVIGSTGQTEARFNDVGYGQNGVSFESRTLAPYTGNYDFIRKVSTQRFNPSVGAVGTLDPMWLTLQNVPSKKFGGGCPGDSGSGVFVQNMNMVVAVHTGGYHIGYYNQLCGRMTSLNHRVDLPVVLDWIEPYLD